MNTPVFGHLESASPPYIDPETLRVPRIEQANRAITQMDQVMPQNAALVEQASAAAQSMRDQSGAVVDAVSVCRLAGAGAEQAAAPASGGDAARSAAAGC